MIMQNVKALKRSFNYSYLLLLPFLSIALIPWLKYRIQFRFLLVLPFLWMVVNAGGVLRARVLGQRPLKALWASVACMFIFMCMEYFYVSANPFQEAEVSVNQYAADLLVNLTGLLVLYRALNYGELEELRMVVWVCLASICVSALINCLNLVDFEDASRVLTAAAARASDLRDVGDAMDRGISGFGFAYGTGLLVAPLLLVSSRLHVVRRYALWGFALIYTFFVYKAGYSALIMGFGLALQSCVLYLLGVRRHLYHAIMCAWVVVVIVAVIQPSVFSFTRPFVNALVAYTSNPNYQVRLEAVGDAVTGDTGSYAVLRAELYWESLRVFLNAPVRGAFFSGHSANSELGLIGGHSFVFDVLGKYGLIGVSLFVVLFVNLRTVIKACLKSREQVAGEVIFGAFMYPLCMIAFINPVWFYPIIVNLVFIVPALVALVPVKRRFFAMPQNAR